jgi:hypothetical protein
MKQRHSSKIETDSHFATFHDVPQRPMKYYPQKTFNQVALGSNPSAVTNFFKDLRETKSRGLPDGLPGVIVFLDSLKRRVPRPNQGIRELHPLQQHHQNHAHSSSCEIRGGR